MSDDDFHADWEYVRSTAGDPPYVLTYGEEHWTFGNVDDAIKKWQELPRVAVYMATLTSTGKR